MVFPWMIEEQFGMGPPRKRSKKGRGRKPTNATPTTFDLNWQHSENGPTDPNPVQGRSTFMGVSRTTAAGKGLRYSSEQSAARFGMAIKLLRKAGFTCTIPPEEISDTDRYEEAESPEEKEKLYLDDHEFGFISVENKQNETVVLLASHCDWLNVTCANDTIAALVEEKFAVHFALDKVKHEEKFVPLDDDFQVTIRTGFSRDFTKFTDIGYDDDPGVGTLFELKKGQKVISKCLCSYSNAEMDNPGPTIELFETAKQWRKHGHGAELMAVVEDHFETLFQTVATEEMVKFNVCHVTNSHACRWFLNRGFQNWDGMGEELGKYLDC